MCGIAGFFTRGPRSGYETSEILVQRMCDALAHRGPDAGGGWNDAEAGIHLGHRRLAIVDLTETGAQPMASHGGRYVLSYNGEVYNAPKLRKELEHLGHMFVGTSDTEVILAAIESWGLEQTLGRIAGMFAAALWDRETRRLSLFRDRIGEKPLYYGWVGERFAFASDLAALRTLPGWTGEIDRRAVDLYLRANYVPTPLSIYAGVAKLPAASLLVVGADDAARRAMPTPVPYWSLADVAAAGAARPFRGSDDDALEVLQQLMREVVGEQHLADVPVGALLSGGIDSSAVVALMQEIARPVRTFTMSTNDPVYDESRAAAAVAQRLGTIHETLLVTERDALDLIPSLPSVYTEPFADPSQIPTTLLLRRARTAVTVCLTGDGGDEVFCGYNRHVRLAQVWQRLRWVPSEIRRAVGRGISSVPVSWYGPLLRLAGPGVLGDRVQKLGFALASESMEAAYRVLASQWPSPTPARGVNVDLVEPWILDEPSRWPTLDSELARILWAESVTSLPDQMMVKVDRAAMASSLETRAPLLDHRIVEFAWQLPWSMRVRNGRSKWILRQLLSRYVPNELVDRPKQGFAIPIGRWLLGPLREWAESLLEPSVLAEDGLLDPVPIHRAWNDHVSGGRRWDTRLWGVLMLQAWREAERSRATWEASRPTAVLSTTSAANVTTV
jgi:asparagine synthase (glutamine-hydrolysing)